MCIHDGRGIPAPTYGVPSEIVERAHRCFTARPIPVEGHMRFGVTTAACWARAANPLPDRTGRRFITSHADSFVNEWMIGLLGEAPILAISAELPTGRQ